MNMSRPARPAASSMTARIRLEDMSGDGRPVQALWAALNLVIVILVTRAQGLPDLPHDRTIIFR